jgi:hypothetical protein
MQLPAAAIQYVLQDQRVQVLNIGMRLKEEIDANINALSADTACTSEDRNLLAEFSAQLYDTEAIRKLRIEEAYTPDIWTAACEGKLDAVRRNLAAGTSVNAREPRGGASPLNMSALFGQTAVAELLIERGADVSIASNDGNTALHLAAFFAYPDLVKLLLQHGASIGAKNGRGETPLSLVSGDCNPELENVYTSIGNAINMQVDFARVRQSRPKVAALLREHAVE